MVRVLKITEEYRRLLSYLGLGHPPSFIMKNLSIRSGNYYKKIKTLEKYGYIKTKKVGKILNIQLQEPAVKELSKFSAGSQKVEYIRLHNLWVACEILSKPSGWNVDFVEKILKEQFIPMTSHKPKNWSGVFFDFSSVVVRVTPNKVMFKPPWVEVGLGESPENAKNIILNFLDGVVPKVESLLKVSLTRPRRINMTVSSQHIAFVWNSIAKYFASKNIELRVFDDEGNLRVIGDRSNGKVELEMVNKAFAEEDAEKMELFVKDVVTGKFNHRDVNSQLQQAAVSINKLAAHSASSAEKWDTYSKQIAVHTTAIQKLGDSVGVLTGVVNKLYDSSESPSSLGFFSRVKSFFLKLFK